MKVILLQELKGRGGEGDVVEVKRGYAVNYLFPQRVAVEATKGNLKQLDLRKHNIAKRETDRLDGADKIQTALASKVLVIPARVGEEGQLFGSVTTQQIAEKLNEEFNLEIDRKKIDLRAPIKTAGEHEVSISVYRDIKAVFTINVVDEKASDGEVAPAAEAEAADDEAEISEIAEDNNDAMKDVANKLAQAVDADDNEDVDPAAVADAAVEVFEQAEAVVDSATEAAIDEVLEEK